MQPQPDHANQKDDREVSNSLSSGQGVQDRVTPGSIIDILGSRHRIVALVRKRVLASDLRTHHLFLTQDADGSIQLPRISTIRAMIECRQAVPVMALAPPSATDRMKVLIDMLDAADVRQGDKAIWIFLTTHWTAALEAEFGPHDPPWKIRRWRAALRQAGRPGKAS
jgi:hypothetical protein